MASPSSGGDTVQTLTKKLERAEDDVRSARYELRQLERKRAFLLHATRDDIATGAKKPQQPGGGVPVPADMMQALSRERNDLVRARKETKELEKEVEARKTRLQAATAANEAASARMEEAHKQTHLDPNNPTRLTMTMDVASSALAKQRLLEQAVDEERTLAAEHKRLTADIKKSTAELAKYEQIHWELFRLKAELEIKRDELFSVESEYKSTDRILSRKTQLLLEKSEQAKLNTGKVVMMLEDQKRAQQQRLLKHSVASHQSEAVVRQRALQVCQQEQKLVFYGQAIREVLAVEQEEGECPASDVDKLRHRVESCRAEEDALRKELEVLDANVENYETRIGILERATNALLEQESVKVKAHQERLRKIDVQVERSHDEAAKLIDEQLDQLRFRTTKKEALEAKSSTPR